MTAATTEVVAAGGVVWRPADRQADSIDVCLVHRPRYDDWSLPKGKVNRGEHVLACAVREVEEETGHRVVLGRPLPVQHYSVGDAPKVVYYWAARADDAAPARPPDAEVDRVEFVPATEALRRLSHPRDAETVAALVEGPVQTVPVVLLRHAEALSRSSWDGPDHLRPLAPRGRAEAESLVAPLRALGISRVLSSHAVRCADSVRPLAASRGLTIEFEPLLSEGGFTAPDDLAPLVRDVLTRGEPTLVCSHRPVLPELAAAVSPQEKYRELEAGEFLVIHHRSGVAVATEYHGS